ncbi:wall-associated receptor kinase-like 2 [Silene latifolia]|uniref:wall-associated receptor kinase-like 2 n=1 Tax=Silene latifolia TaxID=37657 RepID=UPI003D7835CD
MGQTQTKKCITEPKFYSNEKHFIDNGSILLSKQIALSRGQNTGSTQLKILSVDEIEKATNNYDPNLVVGRIQSTVFKGVIDDQVVAVKVPRDFHLNHHLIELYLTEAATSMVMNHENLVKIYGGCLETFIPIMVYEYLPNGSLVQHLHSGKNRMKWSDRLTVATDIAYGLSYMHNAMSRPMVHRNVQSFSILLDQSFRAKLSNFGYSVTLTPGETAQKWPVLGSPGCIDPEYIETEQVTEKCDVYSFGVLLLELLTGKQPIMMARYNNDLVDMFVFSVEDNEMMDMIDSELLEQASDYEIRQVAGLALKCVAKKGDERPTMINVVQELWQMQDQDKNKS